MSEKLNNGMENDGSIACEHGVAAPAEETEMNRELGCVSEENSEVNLRTDSESQEETAVEEEQSGQTDRQSEIEAHEKLERMAADARLDSIRSLCDRVIGEKSSDAEDEGGDLSADSETESEESEPAPVLISEESEDGLVLNVLPHRVSAVTDGFGKGGENCEYSDTPPYRQTGGGVYIGADQVLCNADSTAQAEGGAYYGGFSAEPEKIYPDADAALGYTDESLYPKSEDGNPSDTASEEYPDGEEELFSENDSEYRFGTDSVYARNEFSKRLNSFYREENLLLRRIAKIKVRQKEADNEKNISLIVEKIGVQKEICELTVEILSACVYVKAKGKTSRYRRVLKTHIDSYNRFSDEYEAATGRPLVRLEYSMIDDILAGKICRPIPNVYYYGMEEDAVYNPYDESNDRARRRDEEEELVDREWQRYVEGGSPIILSDAEKKVLARRTAEKMSEIKRATERDVLLVGMRSEYALAELEAKKDFLVRSYGLDKRKNLRAIRDIEKKIEKINRNAKRAVETEREDNSRFYLLKALDPANEKLRHGARRERLDALRMRLDILLSERESVNERLIALYGGSDNNLKSSKIMRKAASIRRRSATAMYKKQRRLAKKIDRYRVPSGMKDRAFDLLNKKTQAVATADELYYKLRRLKPEGRAKREMVLEIRRAKKTARRIDREIRYMLRKLRRNQESYEDNKEWASVIAFGAVIFIIVITVWSVLGEDISAYFEKLASQLRGG